MKSVYTNVPLKDAIDIALRTLNCQSEPPDLSRRTMKRLLYMAVIIVHFKCNDTWYVQKDGLAMGASLPIILAKRWLKVYESVLAMDIPQKIYNLEDMNGKRPNTRTKAVECENCLN